MVKHVPIPESMDTVVGSFERILKMAQWYQLTGCDNTAHLTWLSGLEKLKFISLSFDKLESSFWSPATWFLDVLDFVP